MNERLLQFIWQFQYYNKADLFTEEGESLQVIHPGTYNSNQGPDFLDAKIRIGNTTWAGHIELHVHASHWTDHQHSKDKNYRNIILHVVWEQDVSLQLPFQTLVLHHRVSKLLLDKYSGMMTGSHFIACEKQLPAVSALVIASWKERMLVERLQQKSRQVFAYLKQNNHHWEECFWWMLAKNFGATVNSTAFEKIARSIPLNILAKHKQQLIQIESLLFGQAGLLENSFTEDYPRLLQREYKMLQSKYGLQQAGQPLFFLRMRPANFPTIRLAQLAMLVHRSKHLFASARECNEANEMRQLLDITANDYWHYHYNFDEASAFKKKTLGRQMTDNILINTVAVMLFAYGTYQNEDRYRNKALQWLDTVAAEKNSITNGFLQTGIPIKSAYDSQALIQLKHHYCDEKRCLDCAIGNQLLRQ
ncbi:MAG: DUF2851 family protein [Ferruginibacter sp.]